MRHAKKKKIPNCKLEIFNQNHKILIPRLNFELKFFLYDAKSTFAILKLIISNSSQISMLCSLHVVL